MMHLIRRIPSKWFSDNQRCNYIYIYIYIYIYMCVCVCVCVYTRVCVYIYIYIYIYTCVCVYIYIYIYIRVCVCVCECMGVNACIFVCLCVCVCECIWMCSCMFVDAYVFICGPFSSKLSLSNILDKEHCISLFFFLFFSTVISVLPYTVMNSWIRVAKSFPSSFFSCDEALYSFHCTQSRTTKFTPVF